MKATPALIEQLEVLAAAAPPVLAQKMVEGVWEVAVSYAHLADAEGAAPWEALHRRMVRFIGERTAGYSRQVEQLEQRLAGLSSGDAAAPQDHDDRQDRG